MLKNTKALLLSAGFGTRLRPLTLETPKCLVKVNGIPMLEHWLTKLEKLGIQEVLINTHYLSDKVNEFILKRTKSELKISIKYENQLLGTAGTLIKNKNFYFGSNVLFIHADNYTKSNIKGLFDAFYMKPKECVLTMLTFHTKNPKSCGVIKVNNKNIVEEFHEKVENPPSNKANGALYLFNYKFINWIEKNIKNPKDFSCDVIPKILGKINTWEVDSDYIDIGTIESLERANTLFKNL